VKVAPNNKFILVGTTEGLTITILDLFTKQKSFVFESPYPSTFDYLFTWLESFLGEFRPMEITPDSNFIITGDAEGSIRILNISDREEVDCFKYEPEGLYFIENL